MPRFFVRQNQVDGDNITILGEDAHHIARSLRMAVGDEVTVCDMQGNEYDCRITDFYSDEKVTVNILNNLSQNNEWEEQMHLTENLICNCFMQGIFNYHLI